ncbi:hypothetical protein [Paenibacillus sp. 32O-W]|uniref:hypothetical protein n=1 Tax=Paenibacillus sp. 32O-W TaxID=1695218 RepID=UPI0011A275CB|nr:MULTISPECIES: hypothetical protein [Paenibacillaceae]
MKSGRILSIFMSLLLVLSFSMSSVSAEEKAPGNHVPFEHNNLFGSLQYQDSVKKEYILNDEESLKKFIEKDNIEVPEGYKLESVKTTVYYTDPAIEQNNTLNNSLGSPENTPMSLWIKYWFGDVTTVGERYYADQPLYSDWLNGPLPNGITYNLKDTINAGYSTEFGFSTSDISAKVGFEVAKGHEISRDFPTDPVPSGKKLNVKIFTNYLVKNFEEWQCAMYGGLEVPDTRKKGTGSAWKPIGYIIQQYLYSM